MGRGSERLGLFLAPLATKPEKLKRPETNGFFV